VCTRLLVRTYLCVCNKCCAAQNVHRRTDRLLTFLNLASLGTLTNQAFCVQEKLSVGDLYAGLKRASESSRRSQKMVGMLLAASEYSRFIRLMRRRVKKHQDEHDPESDHDGANSSSSSSDDGQGGGTRSSSSNSTSRRRSSREAKV
jgi:hypothetical protein